MANRSNIPTIDNYRGLVLTKGISESHTVTFVTLGCAKNEADSRAMRNCLAKEGFAVTESLDDADFIVLNTCAFIEAAVEESLDTILELAALDRVQTGETRLLVAGCLPSRFGEELARELPEVAAFVPVSEESGLVGTLTSLIGQSKPVATALAPGAATEPSSQPWAYVKISDGCSRCCSYCTIPLIRGSYHSYSFEHIKADIEALVVDGAREIILIGQDTGIWSEPVLKGKQDTANADSAPTDSADSGNAHIAHTDTADDDSAHTDTVDAKTADANTTGANTTDADTADLDSGCPQNLAALLAALATLYPHTWFRVMYLQPEGISEELLTAMAAHENITRYLDIPLQHASKRVLQDMNRKGSGKEYLALLERIRTALPGVTLRTTVMTGFPGESQEDFDELYDFLCDARFDYVGIFAYSREQGTTAADLTKQVPAELALQRAQALRDLADSIGFELAQAQVDKTVDVLICGQDEEGVFGRTKSQAPEVDGVTYLVSPSSTDELTCGACSDSACEEAPYKDMLGLEGIVRVSVTEAVLYDLFGEVL